MDNSTNVGIGTSSPAQKLHIDGGATDTKIRIDADAGKDKLIQFSEGSTTKGLIGFVDGTTDYIKLNHGTTSLNHLVMPQMVMWHWYHSVKLL